jgi:hypothetical protein
MHPRSTFRFVLAATVPLVSCKTVANDGRDRPATVASESPSRKTTGAVGAADAGAPSPPAPEEPLAWGTRPAQKGPLFPVIDGMCVHGEIWPTKGSALYTYGNGTGAWTRGGEATMARLVDDGLELSDTPTKKPDAEAWTYIAPMRVQGTWPGPLVMYSSDQGGGRMRDWPSIWSHTADGWSLIASHHEKGEPDYTVPAIVRGHIVTARREYKNSDELADPVYKAFPLEKGAPAIENLGAIGRPGFTLRSFVANDTTLFALGYTEQGAQTKQILRVLSDGKARELGLPDGEIRIISLRPNLVFAVNPLKILRLDGDKLTPVDAKLPPNVTLRAGAAAPNGDLWLLPSTRKAVLVVRKDGKVDELPLPAPAAPGPKEAVQHWPTSGDLLAGVEVDDPYAIGDGGSLFHFDQGKWVEVELPAPPFAATGKYQAQAVVVPAKGDLYVNAGYAEKGVAWKTVERYRAVLRNKRPKEVLRCNEPYGGADHASGHGFMSFPPIAQDSCATPFVVLLRIGYGVTQKEATYLYDRKTDYPSVREAVKATPSLGASVDLVELVSGDQRYLGARVPTIAAGRELAQAVVKRVSAPAEVRPEIVCGQPKAERTIQVDVATGKLATPVSAQ